VADLNAAVCDTHALVLHAAGDRRLGPRARAVLDACEAQRTIVYVPVAVLWELGLLERRGRIALGRSLAAFVEDLFSNPAWQPLDLTVEQVVAAHERRPNDDPFDALIVAAALTLGLPLVTRDGRIADSKLVKTIW